VRYFIIFLFICAVTQSISAYGTLADFMVKYRSKAVWLTNGIVLYDFGRIGEIHRLPAKGLYFKSRLNGAIKHRIRKFELALKTGIRSILSSNTALTDFAFGLGDIQATACYRIAGSYLAGAAVNVPFARYDQNLGTGGYYLDLYGYLPLTWSINIFPYARFFLKNPDDLQPGPVIGCNIKGEWAMYVNLGVLFQFADTDPWTAIDDSRTYRARIKLGREEYQDNQVRMFLEVFTDVVGQDTEMVFGFNAGLGY
jgi:hypothetical protein